MIDLLCEFMNYYTSKQLYGEIVLYAQLIWSTKQTAPYKLKLHYSTPGVLVQRRLKDCRLSLHYRTSQSSTYNGNDRCHTVMVDQRRFYGWRLKKMFKLRYCQSEGMVLGYFQTCYK